MGVEGWLGRLLALTDQSDDDVAAELRFHIEERIEELEAIGLDPAEARRRVEAEFGDVTRIREETRRVARQRVRWTRVSERIRGLGRESRLAARSLVKSPVFTAMSVLTLALGIGATTAVFTVVDSVLLEPLPYPESDRLLMVYETNPSQGIEQDDPSPPNYTDWRHANTTFEDLGAFEPWSITWTGGPRPRVLDTYGVSASFFDVMGVPAAVGRTFTEAEDDPGSTPVAVLGYGLWQREFAGAPSVVGTTIELEGTAVEVVGVMPKHFDVPTPGVELYLPSPVEAPSHHRLSRYLGVIGRLKPGVTREEAAADMGTVAARLAEEHPEHNRGWGVRLEPAAEVVAGSSGPLLLVLLAGVGVLLLLACVNVSAMLLGRAATRARELAVRAAIGASRARLAGQMLLEALVLAVVAGVGGLLVAQLVVRGLLLDPGALPRAAEIGLDYRVLAFAASITLGTTLFMALLPGYRASRSGPAEVLRSGRSAGSADLPRRALIVAEVALSVILLVAGGLLARSFLRLHALDPGYATEGVVAARVSLNESRYTSSDARVRFLQELATRASEVPGVRAAGITSTLPLSDQGIDFNLAYRKPEESARPTAELPQADYRVISPGYLEAIGVNLLRGRGFDSGDRSGSGNVILINRSFAEHLWPGENPIGKRLVIDYVADPPLQWEVVGVVEDTRHTDLSSPASHQFFVPMAQAEMVFGYMTLVLHHEGNAAGVVDRVRDLTYELDPAEPLFEVETIEQLRSGALARERMAALLIGAFALIALILSAAGVYGVVGYQVARRTPEIGVRMALGAHRGRVVGMVVADAAGTAAFGLVLGLLGSAAAGRVLQGMLHGMDAVDVPTYAGVSVLLMATAILAAAGPARRASGVDPSDALREE